MAEASALLNAHNRFVQRFALSLARAACQLPLPDIGRPVAAMGLSFSSAIGIAAGFDRHGRLGRQASTLGLGFNEIGSLTRTDLARLAVSQQGNARLGLNLTLDASCSVDEHCAMLASAWPQADYLVLNLIGPACAPLLQEQPRLQTTLATLRQHQMHLDQAGGRHVPLVAKVRCLPGLVPLPLAQTLLELQFDGLLVAHDPGPPATRERYLAWQDERAQAQACEQIEQLHRLCGHELTLLSVGGIQTAEHARERLQAGARLVQLYAALQHRGPLAMRALIKSIDR